MGCLSSKDDKLDSNELVVKKGTAATTGGYSVHFKNNLQNGFLQFAVPMIRFVDEQGTLVQEWALETMRGFGQSGRLFSFETGRRAPEGAVLYYFEVIHSEDLETALTKCVENSIRASESAKEYAHLKGGGTLSKPQDDNVAAPSGQPGEYAHLASER